ncbi:MAG: putative toxin-antitoxin system toxin component, PIN family [Candidatus Latescibacteria bacterium]|nr:putative toxin-antitoxin system toxin component, PIN family [Candidatus Latescibacterota bacterium]
MKKKVVVDTNVVYSGLYSSRGASYKILYEIYKGNIVPVLSTTLIFEYEEILKRKQSVLKLTDQEINQFLDNICDFGEPQKIYYLWRPVVNDPKDDHILELAVASKTNCIVTHNIKDFKGSEHFGVIIITPKQLLEEMQ